tara:strand:- start:83 stop:610 length:528 start_codon:yes stop_codon:yes gene_type:complete
MVILNILPQIILIFIGIFVLIYIIGIFVDKKTKPKIDEGDMTRVTSMILISRFLKEKQSFDINTKKLCEEMLCDIFYVLNLFYKERYNFFNEKSFDIQPSEKKEKLKLEFSEIYKKIASEEYGKIEEEYDEIRISDQQTFLNLTLTHELIKSFEKDKDWNRDLTSFWQLIYVSFK